MIKESHEYKNFVVKSNALVEARYKLSLQESQVILWLLTQIHHDDEDFKPHKLEITKFAELTNVKSDNRYQELRKITKQLMQRVMEIYEPETHELIQISWLSSARYQERKGCLILKFDPDLKPYLLQLKSHFTKIDIVDTLKLKSIYAIRIFELLLQYVSIGSRVIDIVDLRAYCGITQEQYADYFDLKRYVINKAKLEINSKTEYEIDYKEIKESRKFVAIEWIIKKKNLEKEALSNRINILRQELRSEAALVESLIEYGYSKASAKKFIKDKGENAVKDAVTAVDIQLEKGKVRNTKAMLRTAIVEGWKPDVFKVKKK